jgi:hypothetical protein
MALASAKNGFIKKALSKFDDTLDFNEVLGKVR